VTYQPSGRSRSPTRDHASAGRNCRSCRAGVASACAAHGEPSTGGDGRRGDNRGETHGANRPITRSSWRVFPRRAWASDADQSSGGTGLGVPRRACWSAAPPGVPALGEGHAGEVHAAPPVSRDPASIRNACPLLAQVGARLVMSTRRARSPGARGISVVTVRHRSSTVTATVATRSASRLARPFEASRNVLRCLGWRTRARSRRGAPSCPALLRSSVGRRPWSRPSGAFRRRSTNASRRGGVGQVGVRELRVVHHQAMVTGSVLPADRLRAGRRPRE
jgi:hypothetical protein